MWCCRFIISSLFVSTSLALLRHHFKNFYYFGWIVAFESINIFRVKIAWNFIFGGLITPSILALAWFGTFGASLHRLNYFVWLRITDEGSVPKMSIWSILSIKFDLKWCMHLSRSLFSYLIECHRKATVLFNSANYTTKTICHYKPPVQRQISPKKKYTGTKCHQYGATKLNDYFFLNKIIMHTNV